MVNQLQVLHVQVPPELIAVVKQRILHEFEVMVSLEVRFLQLALRDPKCIIQQKLTKTLKAWDFINTKNEFLISYLCRCVYA